MNYVDLRRVLQRCAVSALLWLPSAALAQSGGYIVTLGRDTVAIERYTRNGTRIEGEVLRRLPQTSLLKYVLTLNADGSAKTYEQTVTRPDGSAMPNAPGTFTMTFTGDSVERRSVQNGQPSTVRNATPGPTLPTIAYSFVDFELLIAAGKKSGVAYTIGFNPQSDAVKADVRMVGNDSADVVQFGFRSGFKLDRAGHIVRGDGTLTTAKLIALPLPNPDIATMMAAWAAKDSQSGPMGPASPRDTVKATVAGANIVIDYGRPAKRGREIWGKLVPYDTTWRLGANAATQLRTDKDLDFGGVKLPAGFYTLFLYPTAEKAWLLVNSQTGQWGTEYDSTKDVARIPLEKHMSLATEEERFRIFVDGDVLMLHWDRGGYGVRIK